MRSDDQALDNNTELSVRLTYVKIFYFFNLFDVGRSDGYTRDLLST